MLWGGADKKKILSELAPGAVRVKLGKPKFDPIYDFFTERGMHGAFGAVRQRIIHREKPDGDRSVAMWLGGVPWNEEVDIAVSSCVLSALLTLATLAKVYRTRLNDAKLLPYSKQELVRQLGSCKSTLSNR